jgi:pimeloyl-ACP methyl ester carboxylesterase/DNA-binding CsgD family transcriptional regulator
MNKETPSRLSRLHDDLMSKMSRRLSAEPAEDAIGEDLDTASRLLEGALPRAGTSRAWLSVYPDGRVIDFSARAGELLGLDRQGDRVAGLDDRLARIESGYAVLQLDMVTSGALTFQAVRLTDTRTWHLDEALPIATPGMRETLILNWRLTQGEADMAEALLRGETTEAIAEATGRTVGTVRQIIKGLLSKMDVGSQAQAVARMATLAIARATLGPDPTGAAPSRQIIRTPAGDAIGCWRFGDPDGRPVLFFHGALFGVVGRPQAAQEAQMFGVQLFAPERPGYGATALPEGADPVALGVQQAIAILDALQLPRVDVLAHDVGSVSAFALARACPDRVRSITCAPATPPMLGWSQTADMPPLHRVSAFAAQKAPALMEKLVFLGLGRIAREGLAAIPRLVFADSAHDRDTLMSPLAMPVLEHMHHFGLEQDATGFVQDMFVTNRNWSAWLPAITCPVVLMHGALSRTVSAQALRVMADTLPNARLQIVPDAGHTLPISHPTHALRAILSLAD